MKTLLSVSTVVFAISCFIGSLFAAELTPKEFSLDMEEVTIKGTLTFDESTKAQPLVVFIAGSGATNRDGNSAQLTNNHLKLLGEALNKKGIATLRYDKRSIGESTSPSITENNLRFDHFIDDAIAIVNKMQADKRFGKVFIAGHSQGSLVGMVAAQKANIDGFISINGSAIPADKIIIKQLQNSGIPQSFMDEVKMIIEALKKGETVQGVHPGLQAIFRESVQPFIASWMKYNPEKEITKLTCPVLVVQGGKDIQVLKDNGEKLSKASKTELFYLENMNHILKDITGDLTQNRMSYANPSLPVSNELIERITKFVVQTNQ